MPPLRIADSFHPLFLLLAMAASAASTSAQNCALRNTYRLVNSANSAPPAEFTVDSGWVVSGPLVTPGSATGSNAQGCYSTGACTATADYGSLRIVGAGSATACSSGGVFLRLDEYLGGAPKAHFTDRVTVASTVLPLGAPVQLRCSVNLAGFAQVVGTMPSSTFRADLQCNWNVVTALVDTTGVGMGVFTTTVGATVRLDGRLFATLDENGVLFGLPNTGSYSIDLRAHFDVASVTPDVNLIYCSGGAYNALSARSQTVGVGCGAVPASLTSSVPVIGTTCSLSMSGAPPNQLVFLGLASGSPVALPLGACVLRLDPATGVLQFAGLSDPSGQWTSTLVIPPMTSLAGSVFSAQALPLQNGGPFLGIAELSNGLELRLGF